MIIILSNSTIVHIGIILAAWSVVFEWPLYRIWLPIASCIALRRILIYTMFNHKTIFYYLLHYTPIYMASYSKNFFYSWIVAVIVTLWYDFQITWIGMPIMTSVAAHTYTITYYDLIV
ncbi:PREDICTED: uncharacterized protein LOC108557897 [Nicrophorus vespilloides]|uniref:Uncharacterized protein LOC108557897 n=1 Tax=Nicrophorus vespilloides TaxID=110193 RepID=A0ABM1M696_NICVS|nr:PREDICTED: uncharacterized protein LOC108557897 [Nicrophorus vespilloides]